MKAMQISGSTRVGGLIGRGITHSLSPLIHNTAARILGLDLVYVPFDFVKAPDASFFKQMLGRSCYGFNVTVPYKEAIAALFPLSENALTSCNTLVSRETHWELTSTDAAGFFEGLKEIDKALNDFEAVIFMGHGGAAKALIRFIQKKRPALPVFVLKRSTPSEANEPITFKSFEPDSLKSLIQNYPNALLIQSTSAPLRGDDLGRFSLAGLKGCFVDLVYGTPSALLAEAKVLSIPCQDGIPMLIHQALLAQQLWWGQAAGFSDMKAAIEGRS